MYDPEVPSLPIAGWALRADKQDVASQLALFVNGEFLGVTAPNHEYPQLEDVFGHSRYRQAGFVIRRQNNDIITPLADISIYALFDDGSAVPCDIPLQWLSLNPDFSKRRYVYEQSLPENTQVRAAASIQLSNDGLTIFDKETGKNYKVDPSSLRGAVGNVIHQHSNTVIVGWAINQSFSTPADSVVIFRDGEAWHQSSVWLERDDVVYFFGKEGLLNSGFLFRLSAEDTEQLRGRSVRFFALSDAGYATEMSYPSSYPWNHN